MTFTTFDPLWIAEDSIDSEFLGIQAEWSEKTFGPGLKTAGITKHIRQELDEIESDPTDLMEWIDVAILAFDGAWRAGHSPEAILSAYKAKLIKNMKRQWPDWRTVPEGEPVNHVKGVHD